MSNHQQINSFQKDKFLDLSKLKAFADDKINVSKILKFVSEIVENMRENVGYQLQFCFFSHNVFIAIFVWIIYDKILWWKVINQTENTTDCRAMRTPYDSVVILKSMGENLG